MLEVEKVTIFSKYVDYTGVFSPDFAIELLKYKSINNYLIDLIDNKHLPYGLICNLKLIKIKTLKIYIETDLANGFIRPSKLLASILILFNHKKNNSLQFCVNY